MLSVMPSWVHNTTKTLQTATPRLDAGEDPTPATESFNQIKLGLIPSIADQGVFTKKAQQTGSTIYPTSIHVCT